MSNDPNAFSQPVDGTEPYGEEEESFDFAEHRRTAVEEYRRIRHRYEGFAQTLADILGQILKATNISVNSVLHRAKEPESFGTKAATPSENNPAEPKYRHPLQDVTDLAGVRIVTFFPRDVANIRECISREFEVVEHIEFSEKLLQGERFGYQSDHYVVRLNSMRTALTEYETFRDLVAEIQVRTILQHAWAEIEHDIQYKSSITIPNTIRRRFMSLAGMLEIADREFQAIQDEDKLLKQKARTSVQEGMYDQVEITADALRSYLDKRIGHDARTTEFSYEYAAGVLHTLGFTTIGQIDTCIEGYDDDRLSRIRWLRRQGVLSRFEDMLLAGMGPIFVQRRTDHPGWRNSLTTSLDHYREEGVNIRNYDPLVDNGEVLSN